MAEPLLQKGAELLEKRRVVERELAALDTIDEKSAVVCLSYYCDGSWSNSGVIPQGIRQSLIASLRDTYRDQLKQLYKEFGVI